MTVARTFSCILAPSSAPGCRVSTRDRRSLMTSSRIEGPASRRLKICEPPDWTRRNLEPAVGATRRPFCLHGKIQLQTRVWRKAPRGHCHRNAGRNPLAQAILADRRLTDFERSARPSAGLARFINVNNSRVRARKQKPGSSGDESMESPRPHRAGPLHPFRDIRAPAHARRHSSKPLFQGRPESGQRWKSVHFW